MALARSPCAMYHVPWPTIGMLAPCGPNGRCSMRSSPFFPAPRAQWRAYYAAWRAFRWPGISLAASVQGCAERGDAVGRRRLDERIEALGIQTVGAEAAPEGTNTGLEEHGVGLLDQAQVA